jgi:plastocyanin
MSKNILIAIIVIILLAGGYVLVKNSSKSQTPAANNTKTAVTTAPSSAMKESVSAAPSAMKQNEANVSLTADGFVPAKVTIKKGEKVIWTNNSGDTATVNSDPHPTHTNYPPLNLGSFQDGEKHELIFDKPGTYGYHDHFHPSKKGTVVVE